MITNIGRRWKRAEIDEKLLELSGIESKLPNNSRICDYQPYSCIFDKNCRKIQLELRYRRYHFYGATDNEIIIFIMTLLIIITITAKIIVYLVLKRILRCTQRCKRYQLKTPEIISSTEIEDIDLLPPPVK